MENTQNWQNYIRLELASIPENVGLARITIASFVSQVDLTLNDLEEIKVATSEAVSNAIIHGYENNKNGKVIIEAIRQDDRLILTVEDYGKGIEDIEKQWSQHIPQIQNAWVLVLSS